MSFGSIGIVQKAEFEIRPDLGCTVMSISDGPYKSSDFFVNLMCVGSSLWDGSAKVPGERRAPPLASLPLLSQGSTTHTQYFTSH